MGKMYSEAMQEKNIRDLLAHMEFLNQLKSLSANDNDDNAAVDSLLTGRMLEIETEIARINDNKSKRYEKIAWDFTKEKQTAVFAKDGNLTIRPIRQSDKVFYYEVRRQYPDNPSSSYYDPENGTLWEEVQRDQCFYCIVESAGVPIRYIGIKDTRESLWEFAVEFDKKYCGQGYGPRSILLFLKTLEEITLRNLFIAKVEVDNYASQNCMTKIGGKLTGISSALSWTDDEIAEFEQEHADQVDDHMRRLAAELNDNPLKLPSHVLVYEFEV